MANDKRFIVKNGLQTDNINFVNSSDSSEVLLRTLADQIIELGGTLSSSSLMINEYGTVVNSLGEWIGEPIIYWTKVTNNYTASSGDFIIADTSVFPFTINLPPSPVIGNFVSIADGGNWATSNLTVSRNGNTIEGLEDDFVLDIGQIRIDFIYDGATWQAFSNLGRRGETGYTGSQGVQGIQGQYGPVGFTGSRGPQGTSIVLKGSVNTTTDLPGYPDSYTGDIGDAYIVQSEGNLYVWTGEAWDNVGQIVGPQGERGYTGSQGIQGIQGLQGIQGPDGTLGSRGFTGSQGIQGIQGIQGLQGLQGIQGIQGRQGIQGQQGVIGFTGSQGVQGIQGQQGPIGFTGSQGVQGIQGQQGPIGFTGSQGVQGRQGIQGTNGLIGFTGSQGIQGADGTGFTGSQGVQGRQGIQGNQGPIGFTGSQGVQGRQGIQGQQGSTGFTGSQGVQGIQGNQGPIGFTGSQGIQGRQGIQGEQGLVGFTGSQGIQGQQGPIGFTGSQGVQGRQGIQGNQGPIGFTGSQGIQGRQGIQGEQGLLGYTGSQGIQGRQGIQGTNGLIGFTGSQGVQGIQGIAGPSTTINAVNDNTNANQFPVFVAGTGNQTARLSNSGNVLSFNPGTGALNSPTFNATSTTDGGFQGIAADSATAPSFTWTGSLTTGIWHGTSPLSVNTTVNGVNRLSINETELRPTVPITIGDDADRGPIVTFGTITGGSGYTDGTYNAVALTGGSGSLATANIVVSGGAVTSVTLVREGGRYRAGDTLSATAATIGGTGSGFSIPVATVRTVAINMFTALTDNAPPRIRLMNSTTAVSAGLELGSILFGSNDGTAGGRGDKVRLIATGAGTSGGGNLQIWTASNGAEPTLSVEILGNNDFRLYNSAATFYHTLSNSPTANRTVTIPDVTFTIAGTNISSQVFTTAQTFRAANSVRVEAATTQDAIVFAGRAGGTASRAITITPATLAASRTYTLPDVGDAADFVMTAGDQTISGLKTFSSTINANTFNATSTTDGGFQGIAADSVTAPSFTWTDDLDTGMYRQDADSIGFTTGGAERVRINSGGLSVISGVVTSTAVNSRDKLRVWNSGTYTIGMTNAITFGSITNDYAMTFQMSDTANRGFWWGDSTHTGAQGAMSLSTEGHLSVANAIRVGYGESDTTKAGTNGVLDVNGSASFNTITVTPGNAVGILVNGTAITSNIGSFELSYDSTITGQGSNRTHFAYAGKDNYIRGRTTFVSSALRADNRLGIGITPSHPLHIDAGSGFFSNAIIRVDTGTPAAGNPYFYVQKTAATAFNVGGWNGSANEGALGLSFPAGITAAGPLYGTTGSVTIPSFSFSGDPNTGIYNSGTDQLGITTGGTQAAYFDASGNTNIVGNIGVKSATPVSTYAITSSITGTSNQNMRAISSTVTITDTVLSANRSQYGILNDLTVTESSLLGADGVTSYTLSGYGDFNRVFIGSANDVAVAGTTFAGSYSQATHRGTGTISNIIGIQSAAQNVRAGSTTTNLYGHYNKIDIDDGSVPNAYGIYTWPEIDGGTVTNTYGHYIRMDRDGGTATTGYGMYVNYEGTWAGTRWGVFVNGETENYFSNNVTIGSTANGITGTNRLLVRSQGYAVVTINGDTGNDATEPGGAAVQFSVDGTGINGYVGVVNTAGTRPDQTGTITDAFANNIVIGTATGTGFQIVTNNIARSITFSGGATTFYGALASTGEITAYSSDIRLKENIETVTGALEKVCSLTGVYYNWRSEALELGLKADTARRELGLIAQNVKEVIPEAVAPAPFDSIQNEDGTFYSKTGEDYLTVKYEKLVALLIEAVKEQQSTINTLSSEVAELKKLINGGQ